MVGQMVCRSWVHMSAQMVQRWCVGVGSDVGAYGVRIVKRKFRNVGQKVPERSSGIVSPVRTRNMAHFLNTYIMLWCGYGASLYVGITEKR